MSESLAVLKIEVDCGRRSRHEISLRVPAWNRWEPVPPVCKRNWLLSKLPFLAPCTRDLKSRRKEIKKTVIDVIIAQKPRTFVRLLCEAISDEPEISLYVFSQLSEVELPQAILEVCHIAYQSPHADVRTAAMQSVQNLPLSEQSIVAAIEEFIANSRKNLHFRGFLLTCLLQLPNDKFISKLLQFVASQENQIREQAIRLLLSDVSRLVDAAHLVLSDMPHTLKSALTIVLRGVQGETKISLLEKLALDDYMPVRLEAIRQLAQVATAHQVQTFQRIIVENSEHAEILLTACAVLGRFPTPSSIGALQPLLKHPDIRVRAASCSALVQQGAEAFECLVEALGNEAYAVCVEAAKAILNLLRLGVVSSKILVETAEAEASSRKRYLAAAILTLRGATMWGSTLTEAILSDEPDWLKDLARQCLLHAGTAALPDVANRISRLAEEIEITNVDIFGKSESGDETRKRDSLGRLCWVLLDIAQRYPPKQICGIIKELKPTFQRLAGVLSYNLTRPARELLDLVEEKCSEETDDVE